MKDLKRFTEQFTADVSSFASFHAFSYQVGRASRTTILSLISVLLLQTGAMAQNLMVNFDTQFLGTFAPPVGNGTYGVWSNGSTVSDTNINVSFQWSASGNFSATIAGQTLTASTATANSWVYGNTTYSSVMSPSFTVQQLNQGGGFSIAQITGQNMFIEYGTNTIGGSTPPGPTAPVRWTDVEFTYVQGSANNNADLTAINNIGAALKLQYVGATNNASVGFTGFTSDVLPYLASQQASSVVLSASTANGSVSAGGGQFVAAVPGSSALPTGTGFYTTYPAAIAAAITGNLSTPLLTNRPGGANPDAQDLVGAAGFTGTISTISANATNYQVSTAFTPSFSLSSNNTYQITFTGNITAVTAGFTANSTDFKTYGSTSSPLTITVAGGTDSFYNYLSNGNVNLPGTEVTLGGNATAWADFSSDFYNGGTSQSAVIGTQAAPTSLIAAGNGSFSNNTTVYGQIVQRVLGDFQELAMIGAFGNTKLGNGTFSSTPIGAIPSYDIFQDKSYAYDLLEGTVGGFNTIGQYLWINSENITNGVSSNGAIYSNPYDDRFQSGVYIPFDSSGGTLTVQLREVNPVPEPSTLALLVVATGICVFLARRRRKQENPVL